jgi:RHS repeat-associated protein
VQKTTTNKLEMTYDATGNLLCRKTFTTSSTVPSETRDYIGNIEYTNNVISEVHHEQGRYKSISAGVYRHEYTIADHLGNTRIVYTDTDSNGVVNHTYDILDENHYYAYGMELPGTFINVSGTNYNYKFNGIERVESFNIDFAFYRGLDPILGRWYQVDPRAEEAGFGMSPYCAMNNNPVVFTDPNGDLGTLAVIGIYAGVNVLMNAINGNINNVGDFAKHAVLGAINGAITTLNPLQIPIAGDFGLSIAPQIAVGTDGVGFGANLSLSYLKNIYGVNLISGGNLGLSYYTSATGTGKSGFEARIGAGLGLEFKGWRADVFSNSFFSGETSQRTAGFGAGYYDWTFSYENDGAPFPNNGVFNDGKDRYRTAAASLNFGGYVDLKMNLFTGPASPLEVDYSQPNTYPNGFYTGKDSDKYRFGGLTLGSQRFAGGVFSTLRLGVNSEDIRHVFQNQFAHGLIKPQPYFKVLDRKWKFSGGSFYGSSFTHW